VVRLTVPLARSMSVVLCNCDLLATQHPSDDVSLCEVKQEETIDEPKLTSPDSTTSEPVSVSITSTKSPRAKRHPQKSSVALERTTAVASAPKAGNAPDTMAVIDGSSNKPALTSNATSNAKIDKSMLHFGEIRRLRGKAHLRFVASQPCLLCGRSPSDPHHLRFAQPRAMGRKTSDEFVVPLCRAHHRQNHEVGDQISWWKRSGIDPLNIDDPMHSGTANVVLPGLLAKQM
jgi:hypothetical protein